MKRATKYVFILLLLVISLGLWADNLMIDEFVWTDTDKLAKDINQRINPTDPPTSPVRAVAEFERSSAVLIRYPLGIPTAFVAQLSQEIEVVCIVNNLSQENQATNSFNAAGVNSENLSFIYANTDSYWTRDFTAWYIVNSNNELSVLDFEYNRPRPYDNLFPQTFATEYDYPYYAMNIEQTGGNFMTDGYGIAAASHIAYTENSNNQNLVNSTMNQYMGITNYIVVQDPNNTYIDHVDCWGKFLAVDKILIREVATSHPQYNDLEEVAEYFANTLCSWGYPYEVVRVYTPNDQPYSNSLILNDRVFVPQTGSQWDDEALATYEAAMPGYRVFGVLNNTYNGWESTDALHCRTHEIPARDMLSIQHYPLFGQVEESVITLEATIISLSGESIYADSTLVYYKTAEQTNWQQTNLVHLGGSTWSANISGFNNNALVQYYLHSADESGNSEDYPFIGKADPFEFIYIGNTINVPPVINFVPIQEIASNELPLTLHCQVTDPNNNLSRVQLAFTVNGVSDSVDFQHLENNYYSVEWDFAYNNEVENNISYQIIATDEEGLETTTDEYELEFNVVSNQNHDVESALEITSAYPNPFSDNLNITFKSKSNNQSLKVYNIRGQLVRDITTTSQSDRSNLTQWNGRDNHGNRVGSGVYYLVMQSDGARVTKKVLMMK